YTKVRWNGAGADWSTGAGSWLGSAASFEVAASEGRTARTASSVPVWGARPATRSGPAAGVRLWSRVISKAWAVPYQIDNCGQQVVAFQHFHAGTLPARIRAAYRAPRIPGRTSTPTHPGKQLPREHGSAPCLDRDIVGSVYSIRFSRRKRTRNWKNG